MNTLLAAILLSLPLQPHEDSSVPPIASHFIPGDAYFHARVTQSVIRQRMTESGLQLTYESSLTAVDSFQEHVGFSRLMIENIPDGAAQNLSTVYSLVRKKEPQLIRRWVNDDGSLRKEEEVNGIHTFIVSKQFALDESFLGLRYNSRWATPPQESIGTSTIPAQFAPQPVYQSLIAGAGAVIEDWRNSVSTPKLECKLPVGVAWASPKTSRELRETEPIKATYSDVRILILRDPTTIQKWERGQIIHPQLFEVTDTIINTLDYNEAIGEWAEQSSGPEKVTGPHKP